MKHTRFTRAVAAATLPLLVLFISCGGHEFWSTPVASISVSPPAPSMLTGSTMQFTASATFQDGTRKVLSEPVWTTSNAGIVYISGSGMATAMATGSATISASYDGVSGSTAATVMTTPLNSIDITPKNATIAVGQSTLQFSATGFFNDGTAKDISSGVSWASSNTAVASISKTGLATAVAVGSTTITATSGTVSNSTTLTITP